MIDAIARGNAWLNGYVWGLPTIILLMGTGLLLTVVTRAVQFRYLGFALREVLGKITQRGGGQGNVRPFQAVATALASTVGVGNIAGVATAIYLGGPGALFWLWVSGLLGMCTKFAEIVVALHYREADASGTIQTSYSYEPYGKATQSGQASGNTFQYTDDIYTGFRTARILHWSIEKGTFELASEKWYEPLYL